MTFVIQAVALSNLWMVGSLHVASGSLSLFVFDPFYYETRTVYIEAPSFTFLNFYLFCRQEPFLNISNAYETPGYVNNSLIILSGSFHKAS